MGKHAVDRALVLALLAAAFLVAALGIAAAPSRGESDRHAAGRVCFDPDDWGPAKYRFAPCVRIAKLYEDGSFKAVVSDYGGTIRYSIGIGARDR